MRERQIRLAASDGHQVFTRLWEPDSLQPQAVVQIAHGMAEHSGRYTALANFLTSAGYVVIGHDHRGHGHSMDDGIPGHYADRDGWSLVIHDMDLVSKQVQQEYPGLPLFLLGHSMGSFILQQYLINRQPMAQGVILSGSNYGRPVTYVVAGHIARLERLRQGPHGRSPLIRTLSFGSFNNLFKPARTSFDWLSRCPHRVDDYIGDPLCGFDCTNQLWVDLLGGLQAISQPQNLRQIPDIPILILGGSMDPVSSQGKGLKTLAAKLRLTGHHQVDLKLYPDGRHEMFNEVNREEVIQDLLNWIKCRLDYREHGEKTNLSESSNIAEKVQSA